MLIRVQRGHLKHGKRKQKRQVLTKEDACSFCIKSQLFNWLLWIVVVERNNELLCTLKRLWNNFESYTVIEIALIFFVPIYSIT